MKAKDILSSWEIERPNLDLNRIVGSLSAKLIYSNFLLENDKNYITLYKIISDTGENFLNEDQVRKYLKQILISMWIDKKLIENEECDEDKIIEFNKIFKAIINNYISNLKLLIRLYQEIKKEHTNDVLWYYLILEEVLIDSEFPEKFDENYEKLLNLINSEDYKQNSSKIWPLFLKNLGLTLMKIADNRVDYRKQLYDEIEASSKRTKEILDSVKK